MPLELTEDETSTLIDLLVGAIEAHPFPQSRQVQRLRSILAKIRPMPELPNDEEPNDDDGI